MQVKGGPENAYKDGQQGADDIDPSVPTHRRRDQVATNFCFGRYSGGFRHVRSSRPNTRAYVYYSQTGRALRSSSEPVRGGMAGPTTPLSSQSPAMRSRRAKAVRRGEQALQSMQ